MASDSFQTNAMAEVALALAMGFFSIMVLAMVSMGAGGAATTAPDIGLPPAAAVADGKPNDAPSIEATVPVAPSSLLIFHGGRFLDADLDAVDAATWRPQGGAAVLAVDPALPMTEVLAARDRLAAATPTVTVLDPAWLARLGSHP